MSWITLPGLDGSTLLGFMAALGVLEALESKTEQAAPRPKLGWQRAGTLQPVIVGASSVEDLAQKILEDSYSDLVRRLLEFRYMKVEKNGPKEVRSLTPPIAVLRAAMSSHVSDRAWAAADALGTLMCETVVDELEDTKTTTLEDLDRAGISHDNDVALSQTAGPTPFDFTSRNTQFLEQLARIRDVLDCNVILKDLVGGLGSYSQRIMRWDFLVDTPGALFGGVMPASRPAAEWLFFRGIAQFPLVSDSGKVGMAGFAGRRKSGEFSWVLWDQPLNQDGVRTALNTRWTAMDCLERAGRGVLADFTVKLRKDATGYDGAVSASRPMRSNL